eukprot:scaffold633_cov321-Pavlova_lutheri.AAC.25
MGRSEECRHGWPSPGPFHWRLPGARPGWDTTVTRRCQPTGEPEGSAPPPRSIRMSTWKEIR